MARPDKEGMNQQLVTQEHRPLGKTLTVSLRTLLFLAPVAAVACAVPTTEDVASTNEHLDTAAAAECNNLIGEMAIYDLALQSEIANGCTNKGKIDGFSIAILNLGQLASTICTDGYGVSSTWFDDFTRHVQNAWRSQNECLQSDPISTRCPLVHWSHVHLDTSFVCTKHEDLQSYTRACTDPADVPYCQQYFGGSSIKIEKSFCSKTLDIVVSECVAQPVGSVTPSSPGPGPSGAPSTGLGGASSAIDGRTRTGGRGFHNQ